MNPEEITRTLTALFDSPVQATAPGQWQVETDNLRLLVLLSEDESWLRALVPIAPAQEAQPFLEQILTANFDTTQETRYAVHQEVLWGVFQHSLESLNATDFSAAVKQLVSLREQGLSVYFNQFVEVQIRQIIQAAKLQGQSLETTLQTLDRFYEEGLMGEMDQGAAYRESVLAAWRYQLERLWSEVEP